MTERRVRLRRRSAGQGHRPRRPLLAPRRRSLDQGRPRLGQRQADPHPGLQRHRQGPDQGRRRAAEPPAGHRASGSTTSPPGLVVTEKDPEGRPTMFETLDAQGLPRVVSIGRLDINTEGLLLLTNDGGLKRVLELPADRLAAALPRPRLWLGHPGAARCAQGRHRDRGRQVRPDRSHARARAGQQCLAGRGAARRQEPRGQERPRRRSASQVNRLIRVSYGPFQLGELPDGRGRSGEGPRAARATAASASPTRPASISTATCPSRRPPIDRSPRRQPGAPRRRARQELRPSSARPWKRRPRTFRFVDRDRAGRRCAAPAPRSSRWPFRPEASDGCRPGAARPRACRCAPSTTRTAPPAEVRVPPAAQERPDRGPLVPRWRLPRPQGSRRRTPGPATEAVRRSARSGARAVGGKWRKPAHFGSARSAPTATSRKRRLW